MKRMFVLLALVGVISIAQFSVSAQAVPYDAYLMAHFIGEGTNGEQIYFAISTDGLHWTDLNDSQPVLTVPADLGDGGVRDPSLIRSADGTKFWILATDLCIGCGTSWGDAQTNGSTSLVIWESTDLINWSEPWLIDVASSIPNAGCAWAPEAIYDEANANYVIYWATIDTTNWKQTVYYVTTTDFVNVSAPQVYIQRPGSESIIDTQIIEVTDPSSPYQYYRASRDDGNITIEASDLILDTSWAYIGNINSLGVVASEGPMLYKFNDANEWCMMVDQYSIGAGYLPIVSTDLSDMGTYSVLSSSEYDLGVSLKRHGSVLNITTAEYDAILANDWSLPIPPTPPLSGEDISSFFVNLDFDSGDVTTPGPFTGFDTPVDIAGWQDYPSSPLNDAGVEGPGAWWGPYQINAGFMSTGDGAYNISTYPIESNDIFRIGFQAQWWDWTGAAGEWTATLFYDDPANVIGTFVQSGLTSSWTAYSDATFIPATPASVGGTLGILLQSTGGGIAQIDEITIEIIHILNDSPADGATGISPVRTDADNDLVFTVYNPSLGANDVEVYMTAGDPNAPDLIATITAPGTGQLTVNLESLSADLANNTTYYWKAVGYEPNAVPTAHLDPVSGPAWSFQTLPGSPGAPPAAPTSLTAVSGIGSVSLNWDANGEGDLDHYNVYRSQTQSGPYTLIQNVATNQHVDNTVNNGTKYYYVVTAENTSANESGYSNEDSALPPDLTDDNKIDFEDLVEVGNAWLTTYDINALTAITESWLLAIGAIDNDPPTPDPMTWATVPYATGSSSISMTATTASDPNGVEYYFECTSGGGNDSGWQDSTFYEDTGLSPDTQYCYRVMARDKSPYQNATATSSDLCATTDVCIPTDCHVDLIVCDVQSCGSNRWNGLVTVTILDDCGNVVVGATVTGTFTGDYSETQNAVTDGTGVATFVTSGCVRNPAYGFCVDSVSASLPYDSNDNVETCDAY